MLIFGLLLSIELLHNTIVLGKDDTLALDQTTTPTPIPLQQSIINLTPATHTLYVCNGHKGMQVVPQYKSTGTKG